MTDRLKAEIESCRTPGQVRKVLARHNLKVVKDTSPEVGTFSVWIDDTTRIYKSGKRFIVQKWRPVTLNYSGTPTFFATDSYF